MRTAIVGRDFISGIQFRWGYSTSCKPQFEAQSRARPFEPKDSFPEGSIWSDSEDFPSPEGAPSLLPEQST